MSAGQGVDALRQMEVHVELAGGAGQQVDRPRPNREPGWIDAFDQQPELIHHRALIDDNQDDRDVSPRRKLDALGRDRQANALADGRLGHPDKICRWLSRIKSPPNTAWPRLLPDG